MSYKKERGQQSTCMRSVKGKAENVLQMHEEASSSKSFWIFFFFSLFFLLGITLINIHPVQYFWQLARGSKR